MQLDLFVTSTLEGVGRIFPGNGAPQWPLNKRLCLIHRMSELSETE